MTEECIWQNSFVVREQHNLIDNYKEYQKAIFYISVMAIFIKAYEKGEITKKI